MRSRLVRMAMSILVMLSVAAPASAWHVTDHPLPSATLDGLLTDPGAAHHDRAASDIPDHEQAKNHGHGANSDVLGNSTCCDLGCHAAIALAIKDVSPSLPCAASPSGMAEFALDHGPSGFFRPPRKLA